MSKPWGGVGAWALEAERAEAEERERVDSSASDSLSFPSLKESVSKPKKKKGVSLTLSEFNSGNYVGPGGALREPSSESKGLTHDEMIRLPTGPRERTAEEIEQSRHGGGFRSYGYGGGGAPPRRRSEYGMDEEPRRGSSILRAADPDLPSRADEVDNWATAKKFTPTLDSGRKERYGSLGGGGSSKADEVDNWSFGKKPTAPPHSSRNSGFGSGFRDSSVSGADSDRWVRGGAGSIPSNGERERPKLILNPPSGDLGSQQDSARSRPNPFGSARPREEVLASKGVDWKKMETDSEVKKTTRPTSSHSSRPSSAQSSRAGSPNSHIFGEGGTTNPRPKVNPFGDAKPREVLLEEKGMDWRTIDLKRDHRRVERSMTDEEKMLEKDIDHLKKELEETENKVNSDSADISAEKLRSLHELIRQKENELNQLLAHDLDGKVRFGQKASIDARPGSGPGRTPFSSDRLPPSQSGIADDSRNIEFMERPRSQHRTDSWSRPTDDRRGFPQSRDSGFLDTRNADRSKSRETW